MQNGVTKKSMSDIVTGHMCQVTYIYIPQSRMRVICDGLSSLTLLLTSLSDWAAK